MRESKDMLWQDDWELVRRGFGLNESNAYTTDPVPNLYFVLYNKYTGVLRVLLKICRGEDYNAAKITIKFHNTTQMKTDVLEYSRGSISALDKTFTDANFAAGSNYFNDNTKWLYADFPMMFDPCTCLYKSKLNIISELITTSQITLEGKISGEAYTQNIGGKAQIQQPGTFGWKDAANFVNGKYTNIFSSIASFTATTQNLASNLSRVQDTATKKQAIRSLDSYLKKFDFLKEGFGTVPWLRAAVSLVDVFVGGGKQQVAGGPAEVKMLPMAINLTAKLNGTLNTTSPYHNIIFTNPGSKDAALDPDNYPYYNEVLGVFNLIKTPEVWWERREENLNDAYNYPWTTCARPNTPVVGQCAPLRISTDRFRLDTATFKWVLNPASGMTIQNMNLQLVTEGVTNPIQAYYIDGTAYTQKKMGGDDFLHDGYDAVTGDHKFSTEPLPIKAFAKRTFRVFTNASTYAPESYFGLWNIWRPKGMVANDTTVFLKVILNLKRNDATATTQNILYISTFPVKLKANSYMQYHQNDRTQPYDTTLTNAASVSEIISFCNSSTYVNHDTRFSMAYRDSVKAVEKLAKEGITISPNPNNGFFTLKIQQQQNVLRMLHVVDASGRIVFRQQTGSEQLNSGYTKNLSLNLGSGVYYLIATTKRGILKTKIIIAK